MDAGSRWQGLFSPLWLNERSWGLVSQGQDTACRDGEIDILATYLEGRYSYYLAAGINNWTTARTGRNGGGYLQKFSPILDASDGRNQSLAHGLFQSQGTSHHQDMLSHLRPCISYF